MTSTLAMSADALAPIRARVPGFVAEGLRLSSRWRRGASIDSLATVMSSHASPDFCTFDISEGLAILGRGGVTDSADSRSSLSITVVRMPTNTRVAHGYRRLRWLTWQRPASLFCERVRPMSSGPTARLFVAVFSLGKAGPTCCVFMARVFASRVQVLQTQDILALSRPWDGAIHFGSRHMQLAPPLVWALTQGAKLKHAG